MLLNLWPERKQRWVLASKPSASVTTNGQMPLRPLKLPRRLGELLWSYSKICGTTQQVVAV